MHKELNLFVINRSIAIKLYSKLEMMMDKSGVTFWPIHQNDLRIKKSNIFQTSLIQRSIQAHSSLTSETRISFPEANISACRHLNTECYSFSTFGLSSYSAAVRAVSFSILCFQTPSFGALSAALFTRKLTTHSTVCSQVVNTR